MYGVLLRWKVHTKRVKLHDGAQYCRLILEDLIGQFNSAIAIETGHIADRARHLLDG